MSAAFLYSFRSRGAGPEMLPSPCHPPGPLRSPDRSCLMRPLLALGSTGRKSLNQVISGSGLPLAAQSIVAVRVRSTTFSWGPWRQPLPGWVISCSLFPPLSVGNCG